MKQQSQNKQSVQPCSFFRKQHALIVLAATGVLFQTDPAEATPFRTSQLVGLSSGVLGTVGTAEGWAGTSGNLSVTNGSGSLSGTALGLYPSAGDKVEVSYTSTLNGLNTYNTFATSGQYPPSIPINIYYSFLYRFNTLTNMSSTSSNKIVQVNRLGSASGVHFDVEAITNASGKILLGLCKPSGAPVFATTNINVGQTIFVVLRQQIIAGSANDQIDLWINPPPSSFGVDEGSIPPTDASTLDGTEDSSGTGPGRFYIIAGVSANLDELRVSTNSWADVTPPASSCTPASFDSSPTNVTVSEGISANFSVTSSSSSPIYQWQSSTNSGTTWQNVSTGSGGTSASYTTSPLAVSANQTRYRCIASVSCGGGSSATSSVAVVTVSPAVATAPGVLVDDHFADLSRTNAPIGSSNSIWFASAANSLSDGSTGNIVATPGAGSSRLWVSYFTDDTTTNLPVHLSVGRALKASLVFRASNIISNGGNSMRFGLFDYADGGTRVTADAFGSGSTGNGNNVRGYMFVLDYGTNFSANAPLSLYARNVINDVNLMGSTGNFASLGSGPTAATLAGAPAFVSDTDYTLEMVVTRTSPIATTVTATISGGGTNYTFTATDTSSAFPRFDSFAIRPNSLETTADNFTISRFTVQVVNAAPTPAPLNIAAAGNNVTLTWTNSQFSLQAAPTVTGTYTNIPGATSPYTVPTSGAARFFRLIWP